MVNKMLTHIQGLGIPLHCNVKKFKIRNENHLENLRTWKCLVTNKIYYTPLHSFHTQKKKKRKIVKYLTEHDIMYNRVMVLGIKQVCLLSNAL